MISKLLKKNEKGFTLMEMLIVVAIIAVLVAIAIPTFKSSLDKAKIATDTANIRSGYASAMMTIMQEELNGNTVAKDTKYILQTDGTVVKSDDTSTTSNPYKCQAEAKDATSVAGVKVGTDGKWKAGDTITYTVTDAGKITIDVVTKSGS